MRLLVCACACAVFVDLLLAANAAPIAGARRLSQDGVGCRSPAACGSAVEFEQALYKLIDNQWVLVYACQCQDGRQIVVNDAGVEVLKVPGAAGTPAASPPPAFAGAPPPPTVADAPPAPLVAAPPPPGVRLNESPVPGAPPSFSYWSVDGWVEELQKRTGGKEGRCTPEKGLNTTLLVDANVDACKAPQLELGSTCSADCQLLVNALGTPCVLAINVNITGFFNITNPKSINTTFTYAVNQCSKGQAITANPLFGAGSLSANETAAALGGSLTGPNGTAVPAAPSPPTAPASARRRLRTAAQLRREAEP